MSHTGSSQTLQIQGHRGARGLPPKNTLFGFAATLAAGVDALELDVAISADKVVMVHHDSTLSPMTTRDNTGEWITAAGRHPLYSFSLAQLQSYDVGMMRPGSEYAKLFAK